MHGRSWMKAMEKAEQQHWERLLKFIEKNNRDASVQPKEMLEARRLAREVIKKKADGKTPKSTKKQQADEEARVVPGEPVSTASRCTTCILCRDACAYASLP